MEPLSSNYGEEWLNRFTSRSPELNDFLQMIKTELRDGTYENCRSLLEDSNALLAELTSSEKAGMFDLALRKGPQAEIYLDLLLENGLPAQCVYDDIGPEYQHTPLTQAAKMGRLDLVKKLHAAGADLLWTGPSGVNALHVLIPSTASQEPLEDNENRSVVREWLVQKGLKIDPSSSDCRKKMMYASYSSKSWPYILTFEQLGISSDDIKWSPLMRAIAMGTATIEMVDSATEEDLKLRDRFERTPFLLAVESGNILIASRLLHAGADLLDTCRGESNALFIAARNGDDLRKPRERWVFVFQVFRSGFFSL